MKENWLTILFVVAALVVLGWFVQQKQSRRPIQLSHAPIGVAAVRGGNDSLPSAEGPSNGVTDYVQGLQDDVARARTNVAKYQKSAKETEERVKEGE